MHDFSCKNADDVYYENLAKKVKYFKEEEECVQKMGDVMEKLMAKREREAMEKAEKKTAKKERRELAKNLLAENETIERTGRLTTLSVAEVRKLAEKLSA